MVNGSSGSAPGAVPIGGAGPRYADGCVGTGRAAVAAPVS